MFCYGNELKFTYEHLQFQKIFRLANARHKGESKKEEGRGGEGREGGGEGKGEGWEKKKGKRERERKGS
jgi:hypothetical protein